ncbi:MAG: hypothetical protein ACRDCE_10260, partial [Cetobacterium sp.]|uniref:hypothetical protein n=1 Tax=Cetobacterium sp. TaxID=2071632 RepID=UPI003EE47930
AGQNWAKSQKQPMCWSKLGQIPETAYMLVKIGPNPRNSLCAGQNWAEIPETAYMLVKIGPNPRNSLYAGQN